MAALFPILLKKQDEHTFHGSLCRCSIVIEMQALYYTKTIHEKLKDFIAAFADIKILYKTRR